MERILIIRVSKTGIILSNLKCTVKNLIRLSKRNNNDNIEEIIKSLLKRRFHSMEINYPNMKDFILKNMQ